jgi:hypothetical protein
MTDRQMTDAAVLLRLRRFLLLVSAMLLGGTVLELWLVGHTETVVQLIPFALCGLGLIVVIAGLLHTRRATLLALRVCAGLLLLGSLFGVYEHVLGNIAFQNEIHPGATTREVLMGAVGGGNPLLAPGILALAAVLAAAATYRHPTLVAGDGRPQS